MLNFRFSHAFSGALVLLLLIHTPRADANPLVYQGGSGIGEGKHLVFIASDHEYRSEETCPAPVSYTHLTLPTNTNACRYGGAALP